MSKLPARRFLTDASTGSPLMTVSAAAAAGCCGFWIGTAFVAVCKYLCGAMLSHCHIALRYVFGVG